MGCRSNRRALAAAIAAVALVVALVTASAAAARPAPLSHAGRWLTDGRGRVVVLHGTNMVYKLAPYDPAAAGFGADDAAFLRQIGFDAVRVGVIWKALEPQPGVYDDAYLESIAATVRTLARQGIFSVLDFHQDLFNERFQGEGAPDWAVQDEGLPAQPQLGFPANYYSVRALQVALERFWENSPGPGGVGLQDRFAAAWAHVAARFAGDPAVAGYEIFNEPFPGRGYLACYSAAGCTAFDAQLDAFYARVDAAIRAVDRSTMVWYEPNVLFNFGAPTAVSPLADPRSGFAFHAYCLEQEAKGCASHATTLANADRYARATGEALMLTEFGATSSRLDLRQMLALGDRHQLSWLEWMYCACGDPTTAADPRDQAIVYDPRRPPRGANLATRTISSLVEPYPRRIAGTPLGWGFDPGRRAFHLRFSVRRADDRGRFPVGAVTEVSVPDLVYGRGYRVVARGAKVVSAPGAAVLRLASTRRRGLVSVSVTPR